MHGSGSGTCGRNRSSRECFEEEARDRQQAAQAQHGAQALATHGPQDGTQEQAVKRSRSRPAKRSVAQRTAAARLERARITHGILTHWKQDAGGYVGRGASGATYEVRPVVERHKPMWWQRGKPDKIVVVWKLSGAGFGSSIFATTGDALEAADAYEMRLESKRSA